MGKTWSLSRSDNGSPLATNNATRYYAIEGNLSFSTTVNDDLTTIWRGDGRVWDFEIYVLINGRSTATTLRWHVNGSPVGPTLSIPGGTTGFVTWPTPATDYVDLNDGDIVALVMVTSTGGGTIKLGGISYAFEGDGGATRKLHRFINGTTGISQAASNTFSLNGYNQGTEAAVAVICRAAGRYSNMVQYVNANGYSAAQLILASRVNGGDGAAVQTLALSATGIFENTSDYDDVVPGDIFAMQARGNGGGGTGTAQVSWASIAFESDNTDFEMGAAYGASISFIDAGADNFWPLSGDRRWKSATESECEFIAPFDMWISNLRISVSGVAALNPFTWVLRVNGADTALAATVPAVTGGAAENNVDVVAVSKGDRVCFRNAAPGTGNRNIRTLYVKIDSTPPPSPGGSSRRRPVYLVGA